MNMTILLIGTNIPMCAAMCAAILASNLRSGMGILCICMDIGHIHILYANSDVNDMSHRFGLSAMQSHIGPSDNDEDMSRSIHVSPGILGNTIFMRRSPTWQRSQLVRRATRRIVMSENLLVFGSM